MQRKHNYNIIIIIGIRTGIHPEGKCQEMCLAIPIEVSCICDNYNYNYNKMQCKVIVLIMCKEKCNKMKCIFIMRESESDQ